MNRYSIAIVAAAIVLALATVALAADNPFVGTWKLNVARSKAAGTTAPIYKSDTVKVEAQDNGLKFTFDRVDADGKALHFINAPKFDGKDHPASATGVDTVSLKRIDANSFEEVTKAGGKETARYRVVISKDGKTSTVTANEKDSKGQNVTRILIYERQ